MKTRLMLLLAAIFFLVWTGCEPPPKEGYHLTFQVDMSDVELADTDTVGLRGSIAPLSWTETYLMNGPDENGIYTVTIPFKDVDYGARLQYKYIINDSIWDNDRYHVNGNRIATICCTTQDLPLDQWNVLNEFSFEAMREASSWDILASWIYTLAKAKEDGLNMEEAAQEIVTFWDWGVDPDPKLDFFAAMDEFYQAMTHYGYFEMLESTDEKISYIKNKDWEIMMYMWNPEEGTVHDVSAEEMTVMFREMMNHYVSQADWTLDWQDLDDHKVKITIMRQEP